MRHNHTLCDLELIADDGVGVLVHSPIWIAAFENTNSMHMEHIRTVYSITPKPKQLDIHGISGVTLETVVEFIYGGTLGTEFTEEVQIALEKLGMKNWVDFCDTDYKLLRGEYCDTEDSYMYIKQEQGDSNDMIETIECRTMQNSISSTEIKSEYDHFGEFDSFSKNSKSPKPSDQHNAPESYYQTYSVSDIGNEMTEGTCIKREPITGDP